MELKPHQVAALNQLSNGKILWGGVGTGKTLVALHYYVKNESPKNLFIITTAKKRDSLDWDKEAAHLTISRHEDSTIHGTMTVDSWNNLEKYINIKGCFFIFDEQRLVGAGAWVKAFYKIARNNTWIMLTATPGDTWLDYIPVFVANGFYKNRSEFKREHVVYNTFTKFPKVDRYVAVGRLVRLRNQILVRILYEKQTVRHDHIYRVEHDKELLRRVTVDRWHVFEERPIRDVAELFICMRRVVNSHRSRLEAVRELLRTHHRLIVFYNFNYELEILRELSSDFNVAEWNGQKHQPLPTTKQWVYLVQYVAGSEGWNCTETNTVCFYSLTYSYKNWEQAKGRIDRLNTEFKDLYYFILFSKAQIDTAIYNSLKNKKSFQEPKALANLGKFGEQNPS